MAAEMLRAGRRDRYQLALPRPMVTGNEATVVGVLPHGQAWAGRPPGIEHLGVGPRVGPDPLEKVEDQ